MWKWLKRHPLLSTLFSFLIINLPQWVESVWSLAEKIGGEPIAMPNIIWTNWITVPLGLIMFAITLWAIRSNRKDIQTEGFLEATRKADPVIALKDMAIKAAEIAEGIKDEVDKDSMNLTSKILTHDYVTLMKQKLQPVGNFEITWLSEEFCLTGDGGVLYPYNSSDEGGKTSLAIKASIRVHTLKMILIQSMSIEMGKLTIPWDEEDSNAFMEDNTGEYVFKLPLSTPRGKQLASLKAIVDGQEYVSPKPFILNLPYKVN